MGWEVRVQECRRSGVMTRDVAQAAGGLVHVGVPSPDEPEQDGHHRHGDPEPAEHHPCIVDAGLPDVKRGGPPG